MACLAGGVQAAYAAVAGHVQFINGEVNITSPIGQTRPAKKGDPINEGDTLTSAPSASAQIKMQDGGFVAVRSDTKLKFDQFVFAGKQDGSEKSFFSLFKGGFRAVTGLIGRINKQNYKITTPAATIGIRGTDHETFVITPDSPLAEVAPAGAYNKVNVGETFMATEKGTIFIQPNQMGYAGGMNQAPQMQPINTSVFTVAKAPAPEAKVGKKEEKKETGQGEQAAKEAVQPAETAATQEEPTSIRETAVVDAAPPATGGVPAATTTTTAAATTAVEIIAPPATETTTTILTAAATTGGATANLITGTVTTAGGQTLPVTQGLYASQAQAAADAALQAAGTTVLSLPVSTLPATSAIGAPAIPGPATAATLTVNDAVAKVAAANALTPADTALATSNASTISGVAGTAASQAAAALAAFNTNGTFADSTAVSANDLINNPTTGVAALVESANALVQTAAATTLPAQNTALTDAKAAANAALGTTATPNTAQGDLAAANSNLNTAITQNGIISTNQTAITTNQAKIINNPAAMQILQTAGVGTVAATPLTSLQQAVTAAQTAANQAAALQAAGDLVSAQAALATAQAAQAIVSAALAADTAVASAANLANNLTSAALTNPVNIVSNQLTAAQNAATNASAALAQTDPAVVSPTPSPANTVQTNAATIAANAPIAAYNNPNILSLPGASHNLMASQPVTGGWLEIWDTNYGILNTQYVLDGNKNLVEMRSAGYSTYDQTLLVQGILNANIKFAGGVAQDTYVASDSSIYMGRWQGGGITITDMAATAPVLPFTTNLGASSAHWVIGQMVPETLGVSLVQSLAGTTSYTMSAFTRPTDLFGNVGTVTNATLSADFTAQTVASTATFTFSTTDPVNISAKNQVFAINQTAMPIINSGFNDSWPAMTTTVSCSGADCGTGTWSAWLYGDFAGTTASSAYVDYALFNRANPVAAAGSVHTDMVQSIIAFNTAIPPTVAPPVTAQPYVQTDVSFEISLSNNYSSMYYYGGNSMTAAANVAPTATTPSFSWDYGCVNCGNDTVQLPGATGAVNGNATSFATTGIQFGRWTNVPSISQTSTYTFAPGQINNSNSGSSWAFAPEGYLDTPTTLSAATGGINAVGVFNYRLDGAPVPTDQKGTAGTLNSLSLEANFATQTVTAALSVSLGATTWTANSVAMGLGWNGTPAGFVGNLTATSNAACAAPPCAGGYLNGAFTGQNYAGAIVGYYINDYISTTSLYGVAALTRDSIIDPLAPPPAAGTPSAATYGNAVVTNGTASPTGKFVVAEGGLGVGNFIQTTNTATATGTVLTSFSTNYGVGNTSSTTITCASCTGQAATDTATGIQFGTWDTGSRTNNSSQPFGGQFHWIEGPGLDPIYLPEVLLGTMSYALDGGTVPTNQNGLTGTLSSARLSVNFTSQTVDIALGLTGVNGHNWTASSTGTPLNWTNYSKNGFWANAGTALANALNVTMDGATVGSGYISGQLTGSGLNGALFQYQLNAPLPMPMVPNTFTASDMVTVQAPSVTVTGPVMTGGAVSVAFPAGTSGTLAVQPATTLSVGLAGGVPITASLSGGVTASVPNLTPDPVKTGVYYGTAATGESVSVDTYAGTYSARYSNFGEWRMLPTPAGPAPATGPFTSGEFAGGMLLTPATSMPVSNYAINGHYSGSMVGGAQDSTTNTPYSLNYGWVDLNANFTTGILGGTATYIAVIDRNTGGFVGYFNDLSLAATIATNAFSGNVTANATPAGYTASPVNVTTGTVGATSGHFYGPNANELTGIWQLASGTIKASGAFGAGNGTSNSAPVETVNGTVALVASPVTGVDTLINTATQYRMVAISGYDSVNAMYNGGMLLDGGAVNDGRATFVAGGLTAFDSGFGNYNASFNNSATLAIGTATASGLGTDPVTGISWGRWDGNSINITDRTTGVETPTALGTGSLHWIATPSMTAPVALPITGTYNYVLAGGTAPTDNLGNVGTLIDASLVANFTVQTVDVGVSVGITNATNPTTLVASGTGIPIQQRAMFDAATGSISAAGMLTATCSGAGCAAAPAPTQARISGAFTGTNGVGVGMMYGFNNGGTVVSGVAALKQGAQIP